MTNDATANATATTALSGEPTPGKRLFYFADPMCSWCWGFSPVLAQILAAYGERAPARLVVGGLRAGETRPMDARAKATIRGHWEHVEAATGQPFAYDFFAREGFVYDTEPACRAAVAMCNLIPAATFPYFAAIQHAFYAEGRDVTAPSVLADLATAFGGDAGVFATVHAAAEVIEATRADFRLTHALGISGFPAIVLNDAAGSRALTIGYQPFAALAPAIDAWLRA